MVLCLEAKCSELHLSALLSLLLLGVLLLLQREYLLDCSKLEA